MNVEEFNQRSRQREPSIKASVLAWEMRQPAPLPKPSRGHRVERGNRVSCYFHEIEGGEIYAEAQRQNVTASHLLQRAWEIARDTIRTFPSHPVDKPIECRGTCSSLFGGYCDCRPEKTKTREP